MILAISASVLLVVMMYALSKRAQRSRKEPVLFQTALGDDLKKKVEMFQHLFPFCFLPVRLFFSWFIVLSVG